MKKIVIVSGIQIINNPRVVKEANLLSNAGYDVEVIGAILDIKSKEIIQLILDNASWNHIPVIDLSKNEKIPKIKFFFYRIKRKLSLLQKSWLNIENPNQLGYFVKPLLKISKHRNADLYIVHLEQALWVGKNLIKQGHNVAIDIEDWYSEDGLPEDRALRPLKLIKECESYLLKNAVYSTTTSKSLSAALQRAYECRPPIVVYNSFPADNENSKNKCYLDRKNLNIPSIIWFSQTVGPGRGLEQLLDALSQVDYSYELHIRGTPRIGYCELLLENIPRDMARNIYFHPQVPQDELRTRLNEHDIGYCGELSDCKNHDLTISNKMMEYLYTGLAVVASDTMGQKEVAMTIPDGVFLFSQNDLASLKRIFYKLLSDPIVLEKAKKMASSGFKKHYSWCKSETRLVELVNMATK